MTFKFKKGDKVTLIEGTEYTHSAYTDHDQLKNKTGTIKSVSPYNADDIYSYRYEVMWVYQGIKRKNNYRDVDLKFSSSHISNSLKKK